MSVELIPQWWRRIFAWFANRKRRNIRTTFHCPACQAPLPWRFHAELLWEEVIPCPACGDRVPIVSYLEFKLPIESQEGTFAETLTPVERPLSTRISEVSTGSGRRWEIPAPGGRNSWLTFSLVWLVFTTLVFGGTFLKAENWAQTLAPLVPPAIGLILLYAGLRMSFARHSLEVDPVELVYTRRFLGVTTRKTVRRGSIQSVKLAYIYSEKEQPVYGLEIKSPSGRIRFGSALAPQEKAWLCQQVREALGMVQPDPEDLPTAQAHSEWRGGKLEMERGSDHALVRSQSRTVGTIVLSLGAFFAGMGFWILQGRGLMWTPWDGSSVVFFLLFNGGNLLWYLGLTGALLAALWLFTFGWISRRTTKLVRADARTFSVIATSGRRSIQHTWNVEEVGSMSVVLVMRLNGVTWYHAVVTLPDRIVTFGLGAPREDLQRAVQLLGDAMGRTQPSRT